MSSCCNCNSDELYLAEAVIEYRNSTNEDQVYRQEKVTRLVKTYNSCGVEHVLMRNLKLTAPEGQVPVLISIEVSETLE